ncbi:MAG: potassium channel protein [Rhodobacteraceae bacterium]|nr:potassium channel protein [Paracoccaceae bacterium]
MKHISLLTLAIRLALVILAGSVFFRMVEGWSWVDSYFFTVVTISTVGYGDPTPATDLGKIGATVLIFAGLGVFAVAIQQIASDHLAERDRNPGLIHRVLMRANRAHHRRHEARSRAEEHARRDDHPAHHSQPHGQPHARPGPERPDKS